MLGCLLTATRSVPCSARGVIRAVAGCLFQKGAASVPCDTTVGAGHLSVFPQVAFKQHHGGRSQPLAFAMPP